MNKHIDIFLCNHFDLTWRRCFDRPIQFKGKTLISYAQVEALYIDQCLALCSEDPGFKFNIESPAVLRKYLESHPQNEKRLRELYSQNRMGIPFTGENIIDGNIPGAESYIRSFQLGKAFIEQHMGPCSRVAYRRDSFGNHAQLPQMLRGFGIDWVFGLSYSEPQGKLWRGIDGSVVVCMEPPSAGEIGSIYKYPPCPVCSGTSRADEEICPHCRGMGIDQPVEKCRLDRPDFGADLPPYSVLFQRSEELIPPRDMLSLPERYHQHGKDAQFATINDLAERMEPMIRDMLACGEDFHPQPEMNPNNTGILATRIEIKQQIRAMERKLASLDTLLAFAALKDGCASSADDLWQRFTFQIFHDAAPGTYVDAAHEEAMQRADVLNADIQSAWMDTCTRLASASSETHSLHAVNTLAFERAGEVSFDWRTSVRRVEDAQKHSLPILRRECTANGWRVTVLVPKAAPLSSLTLFVEEGEPEIVRDRSRLSMENAWFRIVRDEHGLTEIFSKALGRSLFAEGQRPHELLLEDDYGSPWTTLRKPQSRMRLSEKTEFCGYEREGSVQRFMFHVIPLNTQTIEGVECWWSAILVDDDPLVRFETRVYWDTCDQRLRAVFPFSFSGRHLYEIPYGIIEREPYEGCYDSWFGASGDWATANFAGVSTDELSCAVFNTGTPCYRIEHTECGDELDISLVRSPTAPTYLHEPRSYVMTDYENMRDVGVHRFSYALGAFSGPLVHSDCVKQGESLITPLYLTPAPIVLPQPPAAVWQGHGRIAHIKPSEAGMTLRLVEFAGESAQAELTLPSWVHEVCIANMDETPVECCIVQEHKVRIALRPFEIMTLCLKRCSQESGE